LSYLTTPEGVRLRYADRGDGDRTIVLVHGWKGSHRLWDKAVHDLSRRFRVVAFDNRGMGESDKPRGPYDFDELSDDLAFVLRELDLDDVTLVGWSMGCSISLEYLRRHGGRVGRLMLVNGPIKLTRAPEFEWTMTEETLRGYLDDLAAGWPGSERDFLANTLAAHGTEADFDLLYRVGIQTPLDIAIRVVEHQARLDHRSLLPQLGLPVLAAYGRFDPYYPVQLAEYIASHVPNGTYVIFEESAHGPHIEETVRFCEVVADFARDRQARI
jgi:pimeloyl-ACP methyl ester carboxylesterase